MNKRAHTLVILIVILLALVVLATVLLLRQRVERHRVFTPAVAAQEPAKPAGVPPLEQWTETFSRLEAAGQWGELDQLLDRIETSQPELYERWSLGYLQARARIENNESEAAEGRLKPFLATANPLRDLALYHQAEIEHARHDDAAASKSRLALIAAYPSSVYRDQAIDDEIDSLSTGTDTKALLDFEAKVTPVGNPRHRDLEAAIIEAMLRAGDEIGALTRGLPLIHAGTMDDASDRVSRALDRPELIRKMSAAQQVELGDAFRNHRHFDRAVAVLSMALPAMPPPKRDDVLFSIGRSNYGDEKYAAAQQNYLRGAATTIDPKMKATFLWHAARSAQLQNDDAGAEKLMNAAIAVPVREPSTLAALTQRLRVKLKQKRITAAAADLQLLRKLAPNDHAIVDGSLAYALALIAVGNERGAIATIDAVPRKLLNQFDGPELVYWRARALEKSDVRAAFSGYLTVLRAEVPTHFAYFARQRLDSPALTPKVAQEVTALEQQVATLVAAKNYAQAKEVQTDRILLSSSERPRELQKLASIYRELPAYRAVLELKPAAFPTLTAQTAASHDRAALLMSLGLFDEAADAIPRLYPLRPQHAALTQSLALNRGNESKQSIYAIEVLMSSVPKDFHPDLLPLEVRQLLYPRYFKTFIDEDAKRYDADPTLVLSIMREESRFNPRAKSEAAARGLLQFIITTARQIGRDVGLVDVSAEDLYDPRVIIRLGAKYLATLTTQFHGDRYMAAAAYNAGPNQVTLWSRLAPASGDDFFLSSVSFDETKNYVRKVMNSYQRYDAIYGSGAAVGGIRAEP